MKPEDGKNKENVQIEKIKRLLTSNKFVSTQDKIKECKRDAELLEFILSNNKELGNSLFKEALIFGSSSLMNILVACGATFNISQYYIAFCYKCDIDSFPVGNLINTDNHPNFMEEVFDTQFMKHCLAKGIISKELILNLCNEECNIFELYCDKYPDYVAKHINTTFIKRLFSNKKTNLTKIKDLLKLLLQKNLLQGKIDFCDLIENQFNSPNFFEFFGDRNLLTLEQEEFFNAFQVDLYKTVNSLDTVKKISDFNQINNRYTNKKIDLAEVLSRRVSDQWYTKNVYADTTPLHVFVGKYGHYIEYITNNYSDSRFYATLDSFGYSASEKATTLCYPVSPLVIKSCLDKIKEMEKKGEEGNVIELNNRKKFILKMFDKSLEVNTFDQAIFQLCKMDFYSGEMFLTKKSIRMNYNHVDDILFPIIKQLKTVDNVKYLVSLGCSIHAKNPIQGSQKLHSLYCECENMEIVQYLSDQNVTMGEFDLTNKNSDFLYFCVQNVQHNQAFFKSLKNDFPFSNVYSRNVCSLFDTNKYRFETCGKKILEMTREDPVLTLAIIKGVLLSNVELRYEFFIHVSEYMRRLYRKWDESGIRLNLHYQSKGGLPLVKQFDLVGISEFDVLKMNDLYFQWFIMCGVCYQGKITSIEKFLTMTKYRPERNLDNALDLPDNNNTLKYGIKSSSSKKIELSLSIRNFLQIRNHSNMKFQIMSGKKLSTCDIVLITENSKKQEQDKNSSGSITCHVNLSNPHFALLHENKNLTSIAQVLDFIKQKGQYCQ